MKSLDRLYEFDPAVASACMEELDRQRNNIELIASENIVSEPVLLAAGTILTNKYAEGYPAKRYYGGCQCVDKVELIAIERAKQLFGAEHANVQPHSGASANLAVFFAFLQPGDTVMGMDLSNGGHLSHGSPVNISGKYFNVVPYGVNSETELIDYDDIRRKALECHPKLIVIGASAYARKFDYSVCRDICDEVGALLMVDMAHVAGLVAAGLHPNPVPFADVVTTTTHKTLRGPRGGLILCKEKYAKQIDKAIFPGTQGGPLMHIIAAKAVAFGEALTDEFKDYQRRLLANNLKLCEALKAEGFRVVSGGTDNHLSLLDLSCFGISGRDFEHMLDAVHITANKNTVPNDKLGPFVTSGLRVGTAAITSRGFTEDEMPIIAHLLKLVATDFENTREQVLAEVLRLCKAHPIYENL